MSKICPMSGFEKAFANSELLRVNFVFSLTLRERGAMLGLIFSSSVYILVRNSLNLPFMLSSLPASSSSASR